MTPVESDLCLRFLHMKLEHGIKASFSVFKKLNRVLVVRVAVVSQCFGRRHAYGHQ